MGNVDERDRHLIRHLHGRFGTRTFTTREAAEAAKEAKAEGGHPLPQGEPAWAQALEELLRKELVVAEVEGWRLTAAILRAASIINV
jgi:hypothetical protein